MKIPKKTRINKWIDECINGNQWRNFNDLHIDEIYGKTPGKLWINEGLALLETAKKMIDDRKYIIMLAIPLKGIAVENDFPVSFDSLKVEDLLSSHSPSLYILGRDWSHLKTTFSENNQISENDKYKYFLNKSFEEGMIYKVIYVVPASCTVVDIPDQQPCAGQ